MKSSWSVESGRECEGVSQRRYEPAWATGMVLTPRCGRAGHPPSRTHSSLRYLLAHLICAALLLLTQPGVAAQTDATPEPTSWEEVERASRLAGLGGFSIRPMGASLDEAEAVQLRGLYGATQDALNAIRSGPDKPAQEVAVQSALLGELESWTQDHPNSSWTPGIRLQLAHASKMASRYSKALQYYSEVWEAAKGRRDDPAVGVAMDASGSLAKLLVLSGRIAECEALEEDVLANNGEIPPTTDWAWALELKAFLKKHPTEGYKCGIYALDQLARLSQPGVIAPPTILESESSHAGLSATELVAIGQKAGMRVQAAMLRDLGEFPVPSVLHLQVGHFVVVRERLGAFYNIQDPVAFGTRWLTAGQLADELSGCVLVGGNNYTVSGTFQGLLPLDAAAAAAFRGRFVNLLPNDYKDSCPPDGCCPPGGSGPPGRPNKPNKPNPPTTGCLLYTSPSPRDS